MKFKIRKTSVSEGQPHPDAVEEDCFFVDHREISSPEEYDQKFASTMFGPWHSKGVNHRIQDGGIARDIPCKNWFIEIEESNLLDWIKQQGGEVIVSMSGLYPSLEIYDDYRE